MKDVSELSVRFRSIGLQTPLSDGESDVAHPVNFSAKPELLREPCQFLHDL